MIRLSVRVQVPAPYTAGQSQPSAAGPLPGSAWPTPQPTFVVAVTTPTANTTPSSGIGTFETLVCLFGTQLACPLGALFPVCGATVTPPREVRQGERVRFQVDPLDGHGFTWVPPLSILPGLLPPGAESPVATIAGVLGVPQIDPSSVPGFASSSCAAPAAVLPAGGQVTVRWACVANATFYVVNVLRLSGTAWDFGFSAPIAGDPSCGGATYSYSFAASAATEYMVTVLATDVRPEMYSPGTNPLYVGDVSTATFFLLTP